MGRWQSILEAGLKGNILVSKVIQVNGNSYSAVRHYHMATKHHPDHMARSLGYMDWQSQPKPFRAYAGTTRVSLPLEGNDPALDFSRLYDGKGVQPSEITLHSISKFLELSMGLSAWKEAGRSRWALRMNPSSGNLHPTETHLVLPALDPALPAGIYHYHPFWHALERRITLSPELCGPLEAYFGGAGFLVALSSVFWREAWKYGERALRYCLLDTGHALGALRFAAGLLGWRVTWLSGLDQTSAERLLGFDRTQWPRHEREHVELVGRVHTADEAVADEVPSEALLTTLGNAAVAGTPETLSRDHQPWTIITDTATHLRRASSVPVPAAVGHGSHSDAPERAPSAAALIRQRRSGLAFRADAVMPRLSFLSMLSRTLPRLGQVPFDNGFLAPEVHLLLFVHQVEKVDPGLYILCRNRRDQMDLKNLMHPSFEWTQVDAALPLYRLHVGDVRQRAAEVSCRQALAGEGVFSLGMLARFDAVLRSAPWRYSELFWEAGLIGQVLYLEAEAHGFRGTGIGCFFDDAVHRWVGLDSEVFQSLYHFTVGLPIEDHRLKTYAPYGHLETMSENSQR